MRGVICILVLMAMGCEEVPPKFSGEDGLSMMESSDLADGGEGYDTDTSGSYDTDEVEGDTGDPENPYSCLGLCVFVPEGGNPNTACGATVWPDYLHTCPEGLLCCGPTI